MSIATLPLSALADLDWRARGLCLTEDPDLMHPEPRDRVGQERAKVVCAGCPVAEQCFLDALRFEDWHGVRAGMTGEERREWKARRDGRECVRCKEHFIPRIWNQKKCKPCCQLTDGHHYGQPRRACNACGRGDVPIRHDTGRLARHRAPGYDKRRRFCRGEETEQRATYLHEISHCEHRPEWRQPGGLCGGCGKDDFAEIKEAA